MVKLEYSRYYAIIEYEWVTTVRIVYDSLVILTDLMSLLLSFVC